MMNDRLYEWIIEGVPSAAARRELASALEQDPALREAFSRWRQVQRRLRSEIDRDLPDRELLVLYVLDRSEESLLSPDERKQLEAARTRLEDALRAHPGLENVVDRIQDEKESFEAVWNEYATNDSVSRPTPIWQLSTPWMARAAAVVGFMVMTGIVYLLLWTPQSSLETVRIPADQQQTIELADGSVVRLMGGTVFSYATGQSESSVRETQLQGRALFEVTAGEHPFVVETSTAKTRVLGTTFGLVSDSSQTQLTVAEGHVAFSRTDDMLNTVVVTRGQSSRVGDTGGPSEPVDVNLTEALAWSGRFFFRESTLADVVDRLRSAYDTSISVAPHLVDEPVTGTFERDRPVEEILDALAATLDARVEVTSDGGYHVTP